MENKIYLAIISFCENLEHEKIYRGNGHHLAQKLTKLIADKLEEYEKSKS